MSLDRKVRFALTLACALAACDSTAPKQGASPPPARSTASSAPSAEKPPVEAPPAPREASPFKAPREERTSSYEVTWSVSTEAKGGNERMLKLEYAVKAIKELYIADRLWDDGAEHRRVPDPFGIYRFVQDGSLRLVLAQAPHPPNVRLGKLYTPLYSRIPAGETRRQTVRIKLPVDEYSALARDVSSPTVVEEVSRVFFVLGYRLRSTMDEDPTPPAGETPESAGYVVHAPQHIILSLETDKIPVKRRTGYIARFPLPGEPGPAPIPVEQLR